MWKSDRSWAAGLHFGNTWDALNVPHRISGRTCAPGSVGSTPPPPRCGRSAEVGVVILRQVRKGRGLRKAEARGRQVVRAEPMSTLDAELNDFGAQLAMLGGHAADRDG